MAFHQEKKMILASGTNLLIRTAEIQDGHEILSYIDAISYESENLTFGPGEFNKTIEQEEKYLQLMRNSPNLIMILGIIDNQIVSVGDISGGTRPRVAKSADIHISVRKDFWGQKIGRYMMEYLIEWGKSKRHLRKINLQVREDNYHAIQLYSKLGFKHEGRCTRGFYINDQFYSLLYMGLEID